MRLVNLNHIRNWVCTFLTRERCYRGLYQGKVEIYVNTKFSWIINLNHSYFLQTHLNQVCEVLPRSTSMKSQDLYIQLSLHDKNNLNLIIIFCKHICIKSESCYCGLCQGKVKIQMYIKFLSIIKLRNLIIIFCKNICN